MLQESAHLRKTKFRHWVEFSFSFKADKYFLKKHLHFKSSSPIITLASRIRNYFLTQIEYAPLAQLVEHLTLNQGVQGSSPWRRT